MFAGEGGGGCAYYEVGYLAVAVGYYFYDVGMLVDF